MATRKIEWKQSKLISPFEEAQSLGFDLRKFDGLNGEVQNNLKKAIVSRILKVIRDGWDQSVENIENKNYFSYIQSGVYVISIGHGFGVAYESGCSEVMYIGRGQIEKRLRLHLNNWIFDMSRSLRDVSFKFYLEELQDGRSPDIYKDFEHSLLEQFHEKFGEKPLLNKIAGREGRIDHSFTGNANAPLNNQGKKFLWQIRPSTRNPWFKPVGDG